MPATYWCDRVLCPYILGPLKELIYKVQQTDHHLCIFTYIYLQFILCFHQKNDLQQR